jgi:hypothetical protein
MCKSVRDFYTKDFGIRSSEKAKGWPTLESVFNFGGGGKQTFFLFLTPPSRPSWGPPSLLFNVHLAAEVDHQIAQSTFVLAYPCSGS